MKLHALWYEQLLGEFGTICGLVANRKLLYPVGLCSAEVWSRGTLDSLRGSWTLPNALIKEVSQKFPNGQITNKLICANLMLLKQRSQTGEIDFEIDSKAYRIWANGHNAVGKAIDYIGVHSPGYVPKEVMDAFPDASWEVLDPNYNSLDKETKKKWGITQERIDLLRKTVQEV